MLSELEKLRYSRHFLLDGWDEEKQEKIKNATVFVAGAGGTGSPTITMLALLGVGRIKVCDFDIFEESNKNRQFIHSIGDDRLGMNKAESASMTIQNINPNVEVEYFDYGFNDSNIDEMVGDAQMIFDCVDRFQYKFVLADCAMRKKIPMFFYGLMGYNYFGYIFYPPQTACFHCLFDERKIDLVQQAGCRKGEVAVMSPTLFSAAGNMMTEAVKLLVGYDEPRYNEFFMGFGRKHDVTLERGVRALRFWNTPWFDEQSKAQGFDWRQQKEVDMYKVLRVSRNEKCPFCGKKWKY